MKSITDNLNSLSSKSFQYCYGATALLLAWQVLTLQSQIQNIIPNWESEWQVGLAFLGGAYFVGYLLFFAGSKLDDWIYDRYKSRFGFGDNDPLLEKVRTLKIAEIGFDDRKILNHYKWSVGKLLAKFPAVFAVVERHQAASKFFRSMVVVMFTAAIIFGWQTQWGLSVLCAFTMLMSLFIYMEQRKKATTAVYEYVIIVSSFGKEERD